MAILKRIGPASAFKVGLVSHALVGSIAGAFCSLIVLIGATNACVQRCLDFLSDKYRAVILLSEAHSLTAPEIADLLELTLSTAKIHLHRARRVLQQLMERGCAVFDNNRGVPTCHPKS